MKRGIALGALIAVGALSLMVLAQQPAAGQQQADKIIEVEKLKDNLFVLKGGGGNTAVFIRSNGVVVVDAKNPGWGQPILDKIKTLTDKPVTTLINTHSHRDHVSGNVEFPVNIDIVVQENTKANMQKMIRNSAAPPSPVPPPNIFDESKGRGLPTKTFKDKMTLGKGSDEIDLYYFGRGHTNGDAWIVFPSLRTVHIGDIFAAKGVPLLDANNGGSAVAIADALQKGYNTIKNVDTIITGHSTQMTWPDLKEYIDFNREFLSDVRAARKAGKTIDEVATTWKISTKYVGYAPADTNLLKNNVRLAYAELGAAGSTR